MQVSTNLVLDLQRPNINAIVHAKQNDKASRSVVAKLMSGESAFMPPNGANYMIRYGKSDGTGGMYDKIEDGETAAVTVSQNTATIRLAEQALTAPGPVVMELNIYDSTGAKLTTFSWIVFVEESAFPDEEIVSTNYFNILTEEIALAVQAGNVAQQALDTVPEAAQTATQALADIQALAATIVGNVGIDDTATRTTTTWSSQKIDGELGELRDNLIATDSRLSESIVEISERTDSLADNALGTVDVIPKTADGSVFNASSKSMYSLSSGAYVYIDDISNYIKLDITGLLYGNSKFPLYAMLDANGDIIARSEEPTTTSDTQMTVSVSVPKGAKSLYVNGSKYNSIGVVAKVIANANEEFAKKADASYEWASIDGTLATGTAIKNDGTEFVNAVTKHITVPLSDATKVKVTGYVWSSSSIPLCLFTDANGNIITYKKPSGSNVIVHDVEYDIPVGATQIIVNGKATDSTDIGVVAYQETKISDIALKVSYLPKVKEKLKVILMGDSITALGSSWGTVERAWWSYFQKSIPCEIIANVASASARLRDYSDTVYDGNPTASAQHNNVMGNEVQKIINNDYEAPDIIIIAIGTNDGVNITTADMDGAYYNGTTLKDLSTVDRQTDAGAYRYVLETLQTKYPNAVIMWCTPIHAKETKRKASDVMTWGNSLRIATEYTGQILIDSVRCGINGVTESRYLADNLHPNEAGAKKLGYYNASVIRTFIDAVNGA